MLPRVNDTKMVKRIVAIGTELVDLERKRNEIDNQPRRLINDLRIGNRSALCGARGPISSLALSQGERCVTGPRSD